MKPLVVDLDGTLIKTDVVLEAATTTVAHHPTRAWHLLTWLTRGRQAYGQDLAADAIGDASTLPYHDELLTFLREEKARGRTLVLASCSPKVLVDPIAQHLGIFDVVWANSPERPFNQIARRAAILGAFGGGGFDYVGSEASDLPLWRNADRGYVVTDSTTLVRKLEKLGNLYRVFAADTSHPERAALLSLRPHQWVKNLLLFIPLLTAHRYGDSHSVALSLLGFLSFCLAASGVYVLNDLIDVAHDRFHASKRRRPFASGRLPLVFGWVLWPALISGAFTLASTTLPMQFVLQLGAYVALTFGYSLYLKRIAMVDVLALATLYTIRITAGVTTLAVPLSFWLLTFSMFFFLSLAFLKRCAELKAASDVGRTETLRGRGYRAEDLALVSTAGVSAGYISALVLALYIEGRGAAALYYSPQLLWAACPVLIFWISRAWMLAHRGQMPEDPVLWAIRDQVSRWLAMGFGLIVLVARVLQ